MTKPKKTEAEERKERIQKLLNALNDKETRMKIRTISNMKLDMRNKERQIKELAQNASLLFLDVVRGFGVKPTDEYILLEAIDNPKLKEQLEEQLNG